MNGPACSLAGSQPGPNCAKGLSLSKVLSGIRNQRKGAGASYGLEGGRHELSVFFAIYTECFKRALNGD